MISYGASLSRVNAWHAEKLLLAVKNAMSANPRPNKLPLRDPRRAIFHHNIRNNTDKISQPKEWISRQATEIKAPGRWQYLLGLIKKSNFSKPYGSHRLFERVIFCQIRQRQPIKKVFIITPFDIIRWVTL